MINDLCKFSKEILKSSSFDSFAVGIIDFKKDVFTSFELQNMQSTKGLFFDLASLTKPLTLGNIYLKNSNLFNDDMILLLEHRAGLPAYGRLDQKNWQKTINSFLIKESEAIYSDYSALRLMLELEIDIKKELSSIWDREMIFWTDLKEKECCPETGFRNGQIIKGEVNDDNAFVIKDFCTHAGLFATITGICKTLLNMEKEINFCDKMKKELDINQRLQFIKGWDTKQDDSSLAGSAAGNKVIGHLGFTGTSIWIDLERSLGVSILTNATQNYWHDREVLNKLRKDVSNLIWNNY